MDLYSIALVNNLSSEEENKPFEGGKETPLSTDVQSWIVVRIYANWCGHCIAMDKYWPSLKMKMEKKYPTQVSFLDIEETEIPQKLLPLNEKYFAHSTSKITPQGFPSIYIFKKSEPQNTLKEYKAQRNEPDLIHWIEKHLIIKKHKGGRRKYSQTQRRRSLRKMYGKTGRKKARTQKDK